jgi:hypothetical protein
MNTGIATEAGDGARTHDPQLGKLMLYQLSYARGARILAVSPTIASSRGAEMALVPGPSQGSFREDGGHPPGLPSASPLPRVSSAGFLSQRREKKELAGRGAVAY